MLAHAEVDRVRLATMLRRRDHLRAAAVPASVDARPPEAVAAARREADLLRAVARGDRDRPLAELYDRYERRLFGLGMRILGDPGLAEELVQETFLRLWRTADRFDPQRGTVSAFVFAIARRLAIDLWRRPSSRPLAPEVESLADPDAAIDAALLQVAVRDALASLSPDHREVLDLAYGSDLTQADIAGRLGIAVGTVKSRTYHALRSLQRAVRERGLDG